MSRADTGSEPEWRQDCDWLGSDRLGLTSTQATLMQIGLHFKCLLMKSRANQVEGESIKARQTLLGEEINAIDWEGRIDRAEDASGTS